MTCEQGCASQFFPCLLEIDCIVENGNPTAGGGCLNPENYGSVKKRLPPKASFHHQANHPAEHLELGSWSILQSRDPRSRSGSIKCMHAGRHTIGDTEAVNLAYRDYIESRLHRSGKGTSFSQPHLLYIPDSLNCSHHWLMTSPDCM
jgi:hypothetical protein